MPITRSTWIDDDGTGTKGTILNNAELQKIYDNIDAFGNGAFTGSVNTQIGTLNNWAPTPTIGTKPHVQIWVGASDALITGIQAGPEGQFLIIKNTGGAVIRFASSNAGSIAANQLELAATSGYTPVAPGGFLQLIYSQARWRYVAHEQGFWIIPPFSAADYFADSPMVWTVAAGHVAMCKYRLSGRTLQWALSLLNTTLSGTAAGTIKRAMPGGFVVAAADYSPHTGMAYMTGNAGMPVMAQHLAPSNVIQFTRDFVASPWALGTTHLNISGTVPII